MTQLEQCDGRFKATLSDESELTAECVLLALGFAPFRYIPNELSSIIPDEYSSHTCDFVDPDRFEGKRVMIVGGQQSAFESAALLAEADATSVHVCHRHATPDFTTSDWSWVNPLLERMASDPGWYRRLSDSEREALNGRFWEEGRLKLEPWLGPRVHRDEITIRPRTSIVGSQPNGSSLHVQLNNGEEG